MNYRIFITGSGISEKIRKRFRQEQCEFEIGDPSDSAAEIARKLKSYDPHGLIVRQGSITAEVLDAAASLKVICKHGAGTDNIDVDAATARGIPVLFTPGTTAESAAEHALALILSLLRRIPAQDRQIRSGVFSKTSFAGQELFGKTLGVIGFGQIGRRLTELVAPFKVSVLAYHPSCTTEHLPEYVSKVHEIEDLFCHADIISLHCPLTESTQGMINNTSIKQMQAGAYIINTARGGLVNEAHLIAALRKKRIAGAALDCFEAEPLAADSPLLELDNVIVTAHVAGASDASLSRTGTMAIEQVITVLKSGPVEMHAVLNAEVFKK